VAGYRLAVFRTGRKPSTAGTPSSPFPPPQRRSGGGVIRRIATDSPTTPSRWYRAVRGTRSGRAPVGGGAPLPEPVLLLIEEGIDGTAATYGFGRDGTSCGDYWDESPAHARRWAAETFDLDGNDWTPVPSDVVDAYAWAAARAGRAA
jgi:hypothetical protein